jgi:hypothetical protein
VIVQQTILLFVALGGLMWLMLGVTVRRKRLTEESCANCDYSLVGIDEPVCPECGRERILARKRDTAGTISHIISVAVVASFISALVIELSPEFVSQRVDGFISIAPSIQPVVSFEGITEKWRYPPQDDWYSDSPRLEPDRIRFSAGSRSLEVESEATSGEWIDAATGNAVTAAEVTAAFGVTGIEAEIQSLLDSSWAQLSMSMNQHRLPSGSPYVQVIGFSAGDSHMPHVWYAMLLVIWGLAARRIWSLFR